MNRSIIKKFFYMFGVILIGGCASTPQQEPPAYYHDGVRIPKDFVRNAWFEDLAENNIGLYASTIRAVIASKKLNKEIFVGKKRHIEGIDIHYEYYLAFKNPNGENVLSVIWSNKEIRFDHYNDSDGKPMAFFADKYIVKRETHTLHKELRLGEFN